MEDSLISKLKDKYPFLKPDEIENFALNHSWLKQEEDMSIVKEYLMRHFQSIADRNLAIYEMISKD